MTLGGGQAGGAGGPGWGPENSLSGDQALPGAPTAAALRAGGGASCAGRPSARAPGYRSSRAPGMGWALCSDPEVEACEVILQSRLLQQRLSAR